MESTPSTSSLLFERVRQRAIQKKQEREHQRALESSLKTTRTFDLALKTETPAPPPPPPLAMTPSRADVVQHSASRFSHTFSPVRVAPAAVAGEAHVTTSHSATANPQIRTDPFPAFKNRVHHVVNDRNADEEEDERDEQGWPTHGWRGSINTTDKQIDVVELDNEGYMVGSPAYGCGAYSPVYESGDPVWDDEEDESEDMKSHISVSDGTDDMDESEEQASDVEDDHEDREPDSVSSQLDLDEDASAACEVESSLTSTSTAVSDTASSESVPPKDDTVELGDESSRIKVALSRVAETVERVQASVDSLTELVPTVKPVSKRKRFTESWSGDEMETVEVKKVKTETGFVAKVAWTAVSMLAGAVIGVAFVGFCL
ncbi:hypothetical protein HDU98_004938 [Podochytrium sp. JEL0797]|nr:hypothetical protein HDU98_004938 [Podochytrium sp. JEL0797]